MNAFNQNCVYKQEQTWRRKKASVEETCWNRFVSS